MTILEMSVSAALFILAATVIRALSIHKLPHKSFLFLWGLALVLLFVPLRIPSPISLFSLLAGTGQAAPAPVNLPALTGRSGSGGFGGFAPAPATTGQGINTAMAAPLLWAQLSPLMLVWLAGCVLFAVFFLVTHLRCRRRYKMSLPCKNAHVNEWLAAHKLHRPVQVRVSDQVSAPLTYGVLRPVILLPKGIDWSNQKQMDYILTHEWMHIRRFDVAFKFLLVAAVCLHWFNPLVWVLFVLAGRDIELACDEAVVRATGIDKKKDYALALINLEERRSRFAPLCTSFSKNGVDERIKGIMKWKKTTVVSVLMALVLVAGAVTVFATSAMANAGEPAPSGSGNVAPTGSVNTAGFRYALPGEAGNHSGYSDENYAALMALKTEGYREETLADFNARFRPLHLLYSGYNNRDENIEFLVTLGYSTDEIVYGENGETPMEMVGTAVNHNTGTSQYYGAEMDYEVRWNISNPATITVARRDDTLNRCHVGIQAIFEEKSWDELNSTGIMGLMQRDCDALAKTLSNSDIKLNIYIAGVNSAADDADFVQRDYPLLLSLRLDGYEDMSISAFRDAVHSKMNENESAYLIEMDTATRDNRLDRTRYSNADAAFVMNTLIPLTAERWQSWQYGGYFIEAAGMAEYQFTITILDADALTVGQHTGVWQGMHAAIGSALKNAPQSLWTNEEGMKNMLQTAANAILEAENRAVKVELGYIGYLPDDSLQMDGTDNDVGQGEIPPATNEQYEMLLALAVPGYQTLSVADFRTGLLETYSADEDGYLAALEAVAWDMAFERVAYPLTAQQDYFLRMTLRASGNENTEIIRAYHTGDEEKAPFMMGHVFRERTAPLPGAPAYSSNGELAFMVSVDYNIEWHIANPARLTVAQRDAALSGVMDGIRAYIDSRTEDELVGGQAALQAEINRLVALHGSKLIALSVTDLHYDVLDERHLFEG